MIYFEKIIIVMKYFFFVLEFDEVKFVFLFIYLLDVDI